MSSPRQKIGIVSWDFDPPKGGLGRSLQWMALALRDGGWEVVIGSSALLPSSLRRFGHVLFSLLLPFVLPRWIRRYGITSILVPTGPGGIFLLRIPKGVQIIAISPHTYDQQSRLVPGQQWKKIFTGLERRTLAAAHHVLCFSDDTKNALRDSYALSAQNIFLLPHAVQSADVPAEKEKGLCLCVARLEARKGVGLLLEAWPHVLRDCPDAHLVIVGQGIGAPAVDRTIERIGSSVRRIASLPQEELHRLFHRAEVFVCPSYLEGFGLAAAEAMAAGMPVVAMDTEGLRCLVQHEKTGLLFPLGEAKKIADATIRLLQDDTLRRRLSEAALLRTRSWDVRSASTILVSTLARLLREGDDADKIA